MFNESVNMKITLLNDILLFAKDQATKHYDEILKETNELRQTTEFIYKKDFIIGLTITE
jgi:hypothetical protein